MGIDVLLYAEVTPTPAELESARDMFRRSPIADDYTHDGRVMWQCLEFEDASEWSKERVVANVTTRFYGPGYERGDWPSICGAIALLSAAFPGAKVYYGGDGDLNAPEFTESEASELWAHYLGSDGDAYRARSRATDESEK